MFENIDSSPPVIRKKRKNIFQSLLNIISWAFISLFVFSLLFTAVSNLNILGGYRSLIVQSGSMEPTIMTGDVIIIAKANDYVKNDVITFQDEEGLITTHRLITIAEKEPKVYSTKGDANRVSDDASVVFDQIMGKVILTVPKLGYFLIFVRSKIGMTVFVGIPALLIIIDEIANIIAATKRQKANVS